MSYIPTNPYYISICVKSKGMVARVRSNKPVSVHGRVRLKKKETGQNGEALEYTRLANCLPSKSVRTS